MTGFPHEVLLPIDGNEAAENTLQLAPMWCTQQGWRRYSVRGRDWIFTREVPSSCCPCDYYIENRDSGNLAVYCFADPRKALMFKIAWVGA